MIIQEYDTDIEEKKMYFHIVLDRKELDDLEMALLQLYKSGEAIKYNPLIENMVKEMETLYYKV